jgi:adenylate cyclase
MLDIMSPDTAHLDLPDWSSAAAIDWLLTEGRVNDSVRDVFDGYMKQLSEAGMPVERAALIVRTLHPLIRGWGLRWNRETGTGVEASFYHASRNAPAYTASPIHAVHVNPVRIRRKLVGPDAADDFPVLADLRSQGFTDYIADPLVFSDGSVSVITFASRKPGGLTDADVREVERLTRVLAPVIEAISARRTAVSLMETYIGTRSGRKVLEGQVQRGDGETIDAVVWFNDLRNSTALSEELPLNRMLALMNTYFEISALAIQANGGEVLRFVGDAMLGIFPVSDETGGAKAAAERALIAAFQARDNVAEANAERVRGDEPAIDFGIGLHIGKVMYGNVGAPARLDFSVIGPAANRAARVESLTKTLGIPLLASSDFAAVAPFELTSVGTFEFKGIRDPQQVFTLPEFAPAAPA